MLYLLEPTLSLWQNRDADSRAVLEQARDDAGSDLSAMAWTPVQPRDNSERVLRLALIHGVACSRGIVVEGRMVDTLDLAERLTTAYRRTDRGHARTRAHQEAVDAWLGTSAETVERRAVAGHRVALQHAEDIRRAEASATRLLSGRLSPALCQHWTELGGADPGELCEGNG